MSKQITCFKCGNIIYTHEEKETDSRIVTQIVSDAYEKKCDIAILVSADSDMIPAVEIAQHIGQKVFVYFPPNQHSNNLAALANGNPIILARYESRFKQSLLPDTVHLVAQNFDLNIPEKWKGFQSNRHP